MGSSNKAIQILAGTVLTLLVVSIAFMIYHAAKKPVDNSISQVGELGVTLEESVYTDIEGRVITGNQVQSYVSKFCGDTCFVRVETKTDTTWYNYSNESLSSEINSDTNRTNVTNCTIKTSKNYIEPNAKFLCTIYRNSNDTIMGVIFEQQ